MPRSIPAGELPSEVWVEYTTDHQRLNEYQAIHHPEKDTNPPYTECFVECVEGEAFYVKVKFNWDEHQHDIGVVFKCDGRYIEGKAQARQMQGEQIMAFGHAYAHGPLGEVIAHPLHFAQAVTTDRPEEVTSKSIAVGSLEVELAEIKYELTEDIGVSVGAMKDIVVDEKRHKLGSTVTYGAISSTHHPGPLCVAGHIKDAASYRFVFNYRTRVKLQIMSIIPEDPVLEGDGPPGGTAAAIDGQKEDGNVHLAGLDQKLGGIRAYESALKRIRQLEDDNRNLRANKKRRSSEEIADLSVSDDDAD